MSSIGEIIRSMDPVVLHLSCLPTTKAEELQDHLWRLVGLWVPVEQISVKSDEFGKNFTALVVLDRANLADSLSRWLASVGEKIVVSPAVQQTGHHRVQRGVRTNLTREAIN